MVRDFAKKQRIKLGCDGMDTYVQKGQEEPVREFMKKNWNVWFDNRQRMKEDE